MQLIIKTKNLELTDSLEDLINQRFMGLNKFISILHGEELQITKGKTLAEVFFEIEKVMHHKKGDVYSAEAEIRLPGKKLMARSHGDDLKKVITEVRNELEREIKKHKSKTIDLPRRKYRKVKQDII